jgi:hypothetical protein
MQMGSKEVLLLWGLLTYPTLQFFKKNYKPINLAPYPTLQFFFKIINQSIWLLTKYIEIEIVSTTLN